MTARTLAANALVAGLYAAIALVLPATAFANWRLATALYLIAAFDSRLVVGLALGNAIAGIPQGPIDVGLGFGIGLLTAWACSRLGPALGPLAILVLPTLFVPAWLALIFHAPYLAVLPVVALGQSASALLAWIVVLPVGRRVWRPAAGARYARVR